MIKENYIGAKDRVAVLLALASREPADKGPCPSVGELAAFSDGAMKSGKRKAMMAHLDACPSCYSDWLALPPPSNRPLSLWERLVSGINKAVAPCAAFIKARKIRPFPGLVRAAAACAIFVLASVYFFWPQPLDTDERISELYQEDFVQEMRFSAGAANKIFILPWNKPIQSYGFGSSDRYAPPYRAFGAGLWTGKQELSAEKSPAHKPDFLSPGWQNDAIKAEEWSETPHAIYFSMGRWCFLLRSVCLSTSEVPPVFWEQQKSLLEQIQNDFGKNAEEIGEDARIVTDRLRNIKSAFEDTERKSLSKNQRGKIDREIGILTDRLSPRRVPQ